jgi:hypothetical protein
MVAGLYPAISYDARPFLFRAHAGLFDRSNAILASVSNAHISSLARSVSARTPIPAATDGANPRCRGSALDYTCGTTPAPGRRQQVHAHARISVATYIHKCNRQLASSYRPPAIMGGTKTPKSSDPIHASQELCP